MLDVALLGAGRIGRIHAANVFRAPGVRLKYVVDFSSVGRKTVIAQYVQLSP